jgi:hypothetical protein
VHVVAVVDGVVELKAIKPLLVLRVAHVDRQARGGLYRQLEGLGFIGWRRVAVFREGKALLLSRGSR